eukprot:14712979-Alexandrium_andersonii.AAC.1
MQPQPTSEGDGGVWGLRPPGALPPSGALRALGALGARGKSTIAFKRSELELCGPRNRLKSGTRSCEG